MTRLVREIGTTRFLRELAATISEDFLRWNDFDKSARLASHSPVGVIELMPVADARRFAFKYVNGHPANTARGLFTVMAFGVLAEVETGYPVLLSELTLATALRTAATSAMVARHLARPDSRRMALIGNGAQSEFQALAFHTLLGIEEIHAFDLDPAATDKLVRNLAPYPGLRVVRAASTAEALRGADIVTTITADKSLATIVTPEMIEPGMHLNAVGGDCPGKTELHAEVLRAARVFVEYETQTRVEGDIQQLPADFPVVELWRVLADLEAGREHARQVTVFDSVGFALEDYSALRYVHRLALELGIGEDRALVRRAAIRRTCSVASDPSKPAWRGACRWPPEPSGSGFLVLQQAPHHLARSGLGQGVDELHELGYLVGRHVLAGPLGDVLGGGLAPGLRCAAPPPL